MDATLRQYFCIHIMLDPNQAGGSMFGYRIVLPLLARNNPDSVVFRLPKVTFLYRPALSWVGLYLMHPFGQFVMLRVNHSMALDLNFRLLPIGVAPITQVKHVRNKYSNIQGRSLNVI